VEESVPRDHAARAADQPAAGFAAVLVELLEDEDEDVVEAAAGFGAAVEEEDGDDDGVELVADVEDDRESVR
jgi:hypothetical protein